MRVLLLSAVAAVSLSAWSPVPARAQGSCLSTKEFASFQVRALQTQLMVGALACDFRDQYNEVVLKHRGELADSRTSIVRYFSRTQGARGQTAFNNFDTELANVQSSHSLRRGDQFCREIRPVFAEVLNLPNAGEVQKYATARNLPQPIAVAACPPPAAPARPAGAPPPAQQRR